MTPRTTFRVLVAASLAYGFGPYLLSWPPRDKDATHFHVSPTVSVSTSHSLALALALYHTSVHPPLTHNTPMDAVLDRDYHDGLVFPPLDLVPRQAKMKSAAGTTATSGASRLGRFSLSLTFGVVPTRNTGPRESIRRLSRSGCVSEACSQAQPPDPLQTGLLSIVRSPASGSHALEH